jgi:hypothetical protein
MAHPAQLGIIYVTGNRYISSYSPTVRMLDTSQAALVSSFLGQTSDENAGRKSKKKMTPESQQADAVNLQVLIHMLIPKYI